jgi:hypothetical protein
VTGALAAPDLCECGGKGDVLVAEVLFQHGGLGFRGRRSGMSLLVLS